MLRLRMRAAIGVTWERDGGGEGGKFSTNIVSTCESFSHSRKCAFGVRVRE
jgi:hypothetical protein